jgi:transposase InsO family protein
MVSPSARRRAADHVQQPLSVSQRRACRALKQARSTQRYQPQRSDREQQLLAWLRAFAVRHPRYGYRRAYVTLRADGWQVNRKCIERLWRIEGLRVPARRQKRSRRASGTAQRLSAEHRNHVWRYDFASDRTSDGRQFRLLTVIDEYMRESPAIEVRRSMTASDVVAVLERLVAERGAPVYVRSDNGPEFVAGLIKQWLSGRGIATLYIDPGSPWQNGYIESFNGKLRDELLSTEEFATLAEATVLVEAYRQEYNYRRPHSALKNPPPAVFAGHVQPVNSTSLITLGTDFGGWSPVLKRIGDD